MTIEKFIENALTEDIGDGDHSSLSTIPCKAKGKANLLVKSDGIIAGVEIAKTVFSKVDQDLKVTVFINDGTPVKKGDVVFSVEGHSISILSSERLVLNFMQRMSGIATETNKYVRAVEGYNAKILDTRKTTPNFRYFEKLSVKIGGGENHRFGLYDMIMIKDNHVDFAGGIENAISAAHKYIQSHCKNLKIEIEVRNFEELRKVLEFGGIDRIMLDNFSPENMKKAVEIINAKFETEASGGITFDNVREYAATGVDYISIGALTHQIKSLDLSLKAVNS